MELAQRCKHRARPYDCALLLMRSAQPWFNHWARSAMDGKGSCGLVPGCAELRTLEIVFRPCCCSGSAAGRLVIPYGRAYSGYLGGRVMVGMARAYTLCLRGEGAFSARGHSVVSVALPLFSWLLVDNWMQNALGEERRA